MLGLVVPPDEFVTMVADANRYRAAVRQLGTSGSDIDANVRARLYWNPKVPTVLLFKDTPADEIYALLDGSRLTSAQAAQLEREYFAPRRHL
jgi:hypothetical protein